MRCGLTFVPFGSAIYCSFCFFRKGKFHKFIRFKQNFNLNQIENWSLGVYLNFQTKKKLKSKSYHWPACGQIYSLRLPELLKLISYYILERFFPKNQFWRFLAKKTIPFCKVLRMSQTELVAVLCDSLILRSKLITPLNCIFTKNPEILCNNTTR